MRICISVVILMHIKKVWLTQFVLGALAKMAEQFTTSKLAQDGISLARHYRWHSGIRLVVVVRVDCGVCHKVIGLFLQIEYES